MLFIKCFFMFLDVKYSIFVNKNLPMAFIIVSFAGAHNAPYIKSINSVSAVLVLINALAYCCA